MPTKVLLDVDVGCDDATAIAMALGSPEIEVIGITTVQGNTTLENTTRNTLSVLELLDRTDIPVARGVARPLVREPITAEHVHGSNGIRGAMPTPIADPADRHAVEFIIDQVRTHGDELTICALGPQTNLALALAQYPSLPDAVNDIWIMGGAALISRTLGGGFNLKNDPEAAARVFQDARPILVGIDVTYFAQLPFTLIDKLEARGAPFDRVADWMRYPAFINDQPRQITRDPIVGPVLHDAVVMAGILEDILTLEEYYVEVTTGEDACAGRVVCDYQGATGNDPNATVAVDVDVERFQDTFLAAIEGIA